MVPLLPPVLLTALAALGSAGQGADDVVLRLTELSAPEAAVRGRAERWLATHLRSEHSELLLRAIEGGDAEVRRRLGRAVGADDGALALVVDLLGEGGAALGVGREAGAEIAARWSTSLDWQPLTDLELARALERRSHGRRADLLAIDMAAPLAETVDRLARIGGLPIGVVLDPALGARATQPAFDERLPYLGTWDQLVLALSVAHGVGLEGAGLDTDGDSEGGAFLRFTQPGEAGLRTGAETLLAWLQAAGEGQAPSPRRDAALRALVETGWPAALPLAVGRWERGDEGALDAVLSGAAVERWTPALARRSTIEVLLSRLRLALGGGRVEEADRIARALAGAPCRLTDGASLPALLASPWESAGPEERRRLLVALEATACAGAEGWEERLRAALAEPAASSELLRQAVRAWAAVVVPAGGPSGAAPTPAAPAALLGAGRGWRREVYGELGSWIQRAGLVPPATLRDPGRLAQMGLGPAESGARGVLLGWWLGSGEADVAAALLAAAPTPARTLGGLLGAAVRRGEGDEVRALLARARQFGPDEATGLALDRVALFAGVLEPERRAALLDRAATSNDLDLLAALASQAAPAGETARMRLLERLDEGLERPLPVQELFPVTEAIEQALTGLLRAGADGLARSLRTRAWHRVRQARTSSKARERLALAGWPPFPPALAVRDLELLDRP
ncbi:MAG: hypothetical protein AAF682_05310 [Planctomycetota bacterium]